MGGGLSATPLYGIDMKLLKDRYEFIIGFVAVIISLSAFKEELSLIRIDLGLFQFSLANYFFYLILGFVITLHIYIIPYILSFTNYSSSKLFSHIELFSYILFTLLAISTTIMLSFAFIWYIIKSIISI
ncbi:MAG: hypothetical protein Q8T08_16805, partial [Ignavibacteria bacterium]|nr:hypothetical protein [Ignavibacteria bacterium]